MRSMPANESRSDVSIVSGFGDIESRKPTSTTNWSKARPASSAVTWKRIARKSSTSSRSSVRRTAKAKKSSRASSCAAAKSSTAASSSSARPRSISRVGRLVAWKRKSSASAPFRTHRSGATATSRRRNNSKATRCRRREMPSPVFAASVFSRSSRAWRTRPRSRISLLRKQRLQDALLSLSCRFLPELPARKET